jgi:hypothetical protein
MTNNEKLDYLLTIFHQNPEMIYIDLYKRVKSRLSWDEYMRLIKELVHNKCLEHDCYVGVRITERGSYKLIHAISNEEKALREFWVLQAKETELSKHASKWDMGLILINLVCLMFNIYYALLIK